MLYWKFNPPNAMLQLFSKQTLGKKETHDYAVNINAHGPQTPGDLPTQLSLKNISE